MVRAGAVPRADIIPEPLPEPAARVVSGAGGPRPSQRETSDGGHERPSP